MKLLFYFFVLISPVFTQAQNTPQNPEIDPRLYQVFDRDYLESVAIDNPLLIKRWNFYLNNAFYIEVYPAEKGSPDFEMVTLSDPDNVNILLLEKEQKTHKDWEKRMVYAITGTDKVLVYYSGKEFTQHWNQFLGRKQPDLDRGVKILNQ